MDKMKHLRLLLFVFIVTVVMLSGCAPAVSDSPRQETTETPDGTVSAAPTAKAFSYSISNSELIRSEEGEKEAIYDAAPYYDADWTVWLGSFVQDGDALYFAEGAVFSDGVSCICETEELGAKYAVVRTDLDGSNRRVLVEKTVPTGYWDVAVLGDRIFFVDGTDESVTVGYVGKDGSGGGFLDFSASAGMDAVCTNALLDVQDGFLTVSADFSSQDTVKTLSLRVDEALNVTLQ
jgi:hypothetical protein